MTQNSMAYRAAQAYRGVAVTVPPLRAMVMLYNGAIMFLQKSIEAQEARRFEEAHGHMMRATAILRGLSHNLDFARGGAVADRLYDTYNALILACLRSFGRRDVSENYRRIIASLTELREAWEFVARTKDAAKPPVGQP
ncbi:flagellar export chaperone FliS [Bradyrhizobium prioriisuperbiae]|uniref:flagellar export chaperone FliS n=1 Tax=Bradyrhizobium prioriisuperbiae TaxID=2854389 RepID=UPI0028EED5ED|nr:flagellar export chaperone FliS [Bradyrhizobium prioritasuperba]